MIHTIQTSRLPWSLRYCHVNTLLQWYTFILITYYVTKQSSIISRLTHIHTHETRTKLWSSINHGVGRATVWSHCSIECRWRKKRSNSAPLPLTRFVTASICTATANRSFEILRMCNMSDETIWQSLMVWHGHTATYCLSVSLAASALAFPPGFSLSRVYLSLSFSTKDCKDHVLSSQGPYAWCALLIHTRTSEACLTESSCRSISLSLCMYL